MIFQSSAQFKFVGSKGMGVDQANVRGRSHE